jgi:hypothetical protein
MPDNDIGLQRYLFSNEVLLIQVPSFRAGKRLSEHGLSLIDVVERAFLGFYLDKLEIGFEVL